MAGLIRDAASPGILKYPTDDSPDPRGTGDRGDLLWLDAPTRAGWLDRCVRTGFCASLFRFQGAAFRACWTLGEGAG